VISNIFIDKPGKNCTFSEEKNVVAPERWDRGKISTALTIVIDSFNDLISLEIL
jgi:hypothetical protein